ncbi:hypothetical protein IFM89_000438 [Coptis chinensis]|uniref:Uncharacterized protein n=1 Tax=Coptis chinensis TaxID=261450 RepID=A0A835I837_9MAGN|nr:hypothetical protein IFM89_000438 [Coptis chinensis]
MILAVVSHVHRETWDFLRALQTNKDSWNEPLGCGPEIRLHLIEEAGEYLEDDKLKLMFYGFAMISGKKVNEHKHSSELICTEWKYLELLDTVSSIAKGKGDTVSIGLSFASRALDVEMDELEVYNCGNQLVGMWLDVSEYMHHIWWKW